jgi:hypothetical protein
MRHTGTIVMRRKSTVVSTTARPPTETFSRLAQLTLEPGRGSPAQEPSLSESLPRNDRPSLRPAGWAPRLAARCRVAWHSCRVLDRRRWITSLGSPRTLGVEIALGPEKGVTARRVDQGDGTVANSFHHPFHIMGNVRSARYGTESGFVHCLGITGRGSHIPYKSLIERMTIRRGGAGSPARCGGAECAQKSGLLAIGM